jgi:hypothetical protein
MKKYCYIEDNKVVLINQELPTEWANVSNFHSLPDDILKKYGWLPLVIETDNKKVFVRSDYIIEDNIVREIIETRDKTEEETKEDERKELESAWYQIRSQRDELLRNSDILVLVDRWENLSIERQTEIKNYRQALRDIPNNFQNPLDVIWPELS